MNRKLLYASGLVVAAGIVAVTACGDSSSDAKTTPVVDDREQAHTYYVERVHLGIATCVSCHAGAGNPPGPRFLAEDAETSYSALERTAGLIAAPKVSPLIQYVHKDPTLAQTAAISPDQRSLFTQWLSLEANARSLEGAVPKAKSVTDAYKQFADCMNFDVWTYYRMGDLAFAQTDSEGPCLGCHATGQGNAYLSAAPRETFEKAHDFPFIQKLVVGKLDERGSFESLLPSKRFEAKANEVCPPESTSCHPRFGLAPNILGQIDGFVATTLQNLATDTCSNGIVVPVAEAGPPATPDGGPQ